MRKRLALVTFAVTALVVIAFLAPLGLLVRRQAHDRALSRAERDAQAVAAGLSVASALADGGITAGLADLVTDSAASRSDLVTVYLPDGTSAGAKAEESTNVSRARSGTAFSVEVRGGIEVLVPVTGQGGTTVVSAFVTGSDLRSGVWAAWTVLAGLGVALITVALFIADRMARSVVRPVRSLAGAAHQLATGNLNARVAPDGPPEVEEVGEAFNYLAGRLDHLLVAERESVADLSHRLRTPLTALRLQAESMADPAEAAGMLADIDRMERAVDQLIGDARRRGRQERAASDLTSVAKHQARFWSVLAEEQGRILGTEWSDEPLVVGLAKADLAALIDTLIENVFSHTDAGTGFMISTLPSARGGTLVVEDGGSGFADEGLIERGDSRSGSTGLGLDIVRRTAEETGGGMEIGNGTSGGARVEVWFGRG